jgi:5-methylcytosine-specific restriction endonuclease McrA
VVDNEAKKRLGYKHPKSKVRFDGSEVLHGSDWKRRKEELWERCGGQCERIVEIDEETRQPIRCKEAAEDPHHIIPRSKGRRDNLSNLEALCRRHHSMLDWKKIYWRPNLQTLPF